jgi:hypothetical protein
LDPRGLQQSAAWIAAFKRLGYCEADLAQWEEVYVSSGYAAISDRIESLHIQRDRIEERLRTAAPKSDKAALAIAGVYLTSAHQSAAETSLMDDLNCEGQVAALRAVWQSEQLIG